MGKWIWIRFVSISFSLTFLAVLVFAPAANAQHPGLGTRPGLTDRTGWPRRGFFHHSQASPDAIIAVCLPHGQFRG
jgi:hypothetical protein